ncbi:hypothetical protein [Rufibacter hautae]|uniref:Uncharacterized protein n=1 Tax=Rufibacter hautae TaxID=2595005 RepID=A0A5B6TU58_9BACT|nr:hypothetical protein [Rufibacter hautae]KAA3440088.1 hypothetical protein FOA19_05325 [Rufibacter hautae]
MNSKYLIFALFLLIISSGDLFSQNTRLIPDNHSSKTGMPIVGTSPLSSIRSKLYLGSTKNEVLSNVKTLGSHPYELLNDFTIKVYEDDLILADNINENGALSGVSKYKGVVLYDFNKDNICKKVSFYSDDAVFLKRYHFFKDSFKEIDGATWIDTDSNPKVVWKAFKVEVMDNAIILEATLL